MVLLVALVLGPSPAVAEDDTDPVIVLQSLLEQRRYDEVQEQGSRFLGEAEGDVLRSGVILDVMVSAAYRAGRSSEPETQEMANRAIELRRAAHGEEHRDVASSIARYALVLAAAGDLEGAREHHGHALAMREAILPANDPDIADTASDLADVLRRLGRYEEASVLFERALAIREGVYGPVHPEVAKVWQNMGNNYIRAGDYVAARDALQRALAIKEEALDPADPSLAYTLTSLGVLGRTTGDYEASRESYERALIIAEASLGGDHPLTLAVLNNLANLLNEMGEYAEAQPLYVRTLELREARLGPDHAEVAETNHNLGILLLRLDEAEQAEAYFAKALGIWEHRLGPDHPHLANALESTGNLRFERGEIDVALALYRQALGIRSMGLGEEHPETGKSHLRLAAAQLERGSRDDALKSAVTAAEILARHVQETVAYMPERQGLAMVAAQVDPAPVLFSGLLSAQDDRRAWAEACWTWTLRRRGLVQEELARRNRRVLEGDTPRAREAWSRYREARAALGEVWVEGSGEDSEAFLTELRRARLRKEHVEVELARVSMEFARRHAIETLDVAELSKSLSSAEVLVEIVRVASDLRLGTNGPTHDLALVLESSGAVDCVDLGVSADMDELVESWRSALHEAELATARPWQAESSMQRLNESSRRLRRAAWDPIRTRIAGAKTVYFVPDGAYHLVDLHALAGDDGRFLIEDGPSIRLLDSGRDLARFAARREDPPRDRSVSILAVGDVDFDATTVMVRVPEASAMEVALYRGPASSCTALREMRWAPLPESLRELQAVGLAFEGEAKLTTLSGSEASEARFKLEAPGRRVLHLATHGFFLQGRCATDAEENPLLLSGLVFAGANQAWTADGPPDRDDGIVTAEEFAAMDLRGTDLAVLSACETGRGGVTVGEGVFGLRRAFHVAGASTVVMSLWPTPDAAARAWMSIFYEQIRAGLPAVDAVRAASLRRLQDLREAGRPAHPQHWAGFVAVGDWR